MLPIRWSLISEHFSLLSPSSHFLHHAEHHHRVYHFCSRLYLAVTGHSVQQWLLPLHPGHLLPVCVVHVQPDAGTRLWQTLHKPGEDRSMQYRSSFRPVRFYQPLHRHFLLFRCQLAANCCGANMVQGFYYAKPMPQGRSDIFLSGTSTGPELNYDKSLCHVSARDFFIFWRISYRYPLRSIQYGSDCSASPNSPNRSLSPRLSPADTSPRL